MKTDHDRASGEIPIPHAEPGVDFPLDRWPIGTVGPVTLRSARLAAQWSEYLETHARRIYGLVNEWSCGCLAGEQA